VTEPASAVDDRFEQAKAAFLDGLASYQAGDLARAEQHYLRSLALLPGRASTLINLAATQLRLARPLDALATAERALAADAESVDALLHLATALAQLGRLADALAAFDRLLELDPAHAPAWSSRGNLLRELQRPQESAQAFREALRHGADPETHTYYLASVAGGEAPPTAPRSYVENLFDDYAGNFDAHLVGRLRYQAHRQLIDRLLAVEPGPFACALDLGCGTGLCGPLVRPAAQRLTGIDLSAGMLAKAGELGAYDRLEKADAVAWLGETQERHDLVLAADVFIYVGDLDPVFAGVRRVIEQGGVFCFSVEAGASGDGGFRLLPSLRYAHSRRYVERLAERHDFEVVAVQSGPVREDQRETVDGLYVFLRCGAPRLPQEGS